MDASSGVVPIEGTALEHMPPRRRFSGSGLRGSNTSWALAFLVPYTAVFLLFVVYPVGYGLWLGHDPSSYRKLLADPIYLRTLVNTALAMVLSRNVRKRIASNEAKLKCVFN